MVTKQIERASASLAEPLEEQVQICQEPHPSKTNSHQIWQLKDTEFENQQDAILENFVDSLIDNLSGSDASSTPEAEFESQCSSGMQSCQSPIQDKESKFKKKDSLLTEEFLEDELNKCKRQLSEQDCQMELITQQMENYKSQLSKQDCLIKTQKQAFENEKNETRKYYDSHIKALENEYTNNNTNITNLKIILAIKEKEIRTLETRSNNTDNKLLQQEQKMVLASNDLFAKQQELTNEKEKMEEQWNQKMVEVTNLLEAKDKFVQKVKTDLGNLISQVKNQKEEKDAIILDYKQKMEVSKKQFKSAKDKYKKAKISIEMSKKNIIQLSAQIKEAKTSKNKLQKENLSLSKELESLKTQNDQIQSELINISLTNTDLTLMQTQIEESLKAALIEKDQQAHEINKGKIVKTSQGILIKKQIVQLRSQGNKIEECEKENLALQQSIQTLVNQIETNANEISEQQKQIKKQIQDHNELNQKCVIMDKKLKFAKQKFFTQASELKILEQENSEKEQNLKEQRMICQKFQSEMFLCNTKLAEKETALENEREELKGIKIKMEELTKVNLQCAYNEGILSTVRNDLLQSTTKMERADATIANLYQQLKTANDAIEANKFEIQNLVKENDFQAKLVSDQKNQIQNLSEIGLNNNKIIKTMNEKYNDRIEELQNYRNNLVKSKEINNVKALNFEELKKEMDKLHTKMKTDPDVHLVKLKGEKSPNQKLQISGPPQDIASTAKADLSRNLEDLIEAPEVIKYVVRGYSEELKCPNCTNVKIW